MATYGQIATLVLERLGLPVSERLRIQSMVNAGLKRLSDKIALDQTRKQLLTTPRTVTVALTNGVANISSLLTAAPFINLDRITSGKIYLPDKSDYPCQWAAESAFTDKVDDLFVCLYLDGTTIKTKNETLDGTLELAVPFVPTIATLPDSLIPDLVDKIIELVAGGDEAEDGAK